MGTIIRIHLRGRKALSNLRSLLFQSIYKVKTLFQNYGHLLQAIYKAEKLCQAYGHYHYNPFTTQKSSFKLMDTIILIHLQGRKAVSSLWTLLF